MPRTSISPSQQTLIQGLAALRRLGGLSPEGRRRELYFRLSRRFTPVLAADCGGSRYFVSTADRVVGLSLFTTGRFADRLDEAFLAIAELVPGSSRSSPQMLIDIGANIGTTCIEAVRAGYVTRALAIEPGRLNVALLRQNVVANDLQEQIRVLPVAVSDRPGEMELAVAASNAGAHWLKVPGIADHPFEGEASWSTERVLCTTVDALIEDEEIDLSEATLVWMDAQGSEGRILAGAHRLLTSNVPLMTEYWPAGLRNSRGLALFESLVSEHYSHLVDMGAPSEPRRARPITELAGLRDHYKEAHEFTDLLLLKL